MASDNQMYQLRHVAEAIKDVDKDRLLRPSVGSMSLEKGFTPALLTEAQKKANFALQYAHRLHDSQIQQLLEQFEPIRSAMQQQAHCLDRDYVQKSTQFVNDITTHLENLKLSWLPVVTAAVEERGFLEDEGVQQKYERTIESIKEESESALGQVKEEADKTIKEARTLAEQIENRARLTAAGISVEEAQKQFQEAQGPLDKGVKIWACLGIVCVVGFFCAAGCFATADIPDKWRWQVLYYGVIRVSILTAIGTVAAFCLKILRAHLHMREKNRHRQHVANSMGAFVESAATPEQRDLILSQLVDSVVQFGNSGLVQREDENIYRPKMTIDSITRTLSTPPQKDG